MPSTVIIVLIVAGIVVAVLAQSRTRAQKRPRQSADQVADGNPETHAGSRRHRDDTDEKDGDSGDGGGDGGSGDGGGGD